MKKILIGCGCLTVLILTVCIGGFVYFGIQTTRFIGDIEAAFDGLKQLEEDYPFTEPDPPRLTNDLLDRYFAARSGLITAVEDHPTYSKFLTREGVDAMGPMEAVRAVMGGPVFVAETMTTNLSAQEMSPSEYIWITQTVGATIIQGSETRNDPTMTSILDVAKGEVDAVNDILQSLDQTSADDKLETSLNRLREINIPETTLLQNMSAVSRHQDVLKERPRLLLIELTFLSNMQNQLREIREEMDEGESPPPMEPVEVESEELSFLTPTTTKLIMTS
ncbi:MAG: hypothetical protein JJU11_00495 [Candidatus Sumerlaeia bacterium]|nr:hypothetical protein [Candidatus Sumerlaeia bacterium]